MADVNIIATTPGSLFNVEIRAKSPPVPTINRNTWGRVLGDRSIFTRSQGVSMDEPSLVSSICLG